MDKSKLNWNLILRFGIIGGGVALYLGAVGLVSAFSQRNLVGSFISFGDILVAIGALGAGLMIARRHDTLSIGASLAAGAVTGMVSSLPNILIILISQAINLTGMFQNISPDLISILTFGQSTLPGILLYVIYCGVVGLLGTVFVLLPKRILQALISGIAWMLGVGLFSENVGQVLQTTIGLLFGQSAGREVVKLFFTNKSLNPILGLIIFIIAFVVGYYRVHEKVQGRWDNLSASKQVQGRKIGLVVGILLLLLLPQLVGLFLSQALFIIGIFVIMGLGLNVVVGFAGLLDLGYVAFFAFGAYTMGILTTTGDLAVGSFSFWLALPIAVLVGTLFGVMLGFPVLQMRGDYLAIVTLGFGEIIRILALSDWLAPIEGGAQGILKIPNPSLFGYAFDTPQKMYYLVLAGIFLAAFVTTRLRDSRLGRQWMAMREDEDVAEAMGINLVQTKLLAFAIGAAFSALAGAIFAARLGNIFPHTFNLLYSINALALIIVGGLGSIPGVVVGAIILVGLPEILREFAEYRLLFYGILLIIMMLVRPEGFLPEATRRRELHQDDDLSQPSEA